MRDGSRSKDSEYSEKAMNKTIWRVEWDIDKGPRTRIEFGQENKALKWAEDLLNCGGKKIVITELTVVRKISVVFNLFRK